MRLKDIFEKMEYNVNDTIVIVHKNPTKTFLKKLFQKSKHNELRGFLVGDLYVWDASLAIHSDLERQLDAEGAYKLVLYPDDSVGLSFRDDTDPDDISEEEMDEIGNDPNIIRAYGNPVEIIPENF